jgi:uncharacterized protein YciI
MFLIELTYRAALTDIDANMAAHVAFLNKYYEAGNFVVSGRQIPRTGGIIFAIADSEQQMEAVIREDPFVAKGLADYRIIQFRASQRASDIQARVERDAPGATRSRTRSAQTPRRR